ncbi:MAG: beta-propeller domain-containing protein [Bacillota bacterium]|nr:beta-propeller domain-containing protein [Bacillota bacterium]
MLGQDIVSRNSIVIFILILLFIVCGTAYAVNTGCEATEQNKPEKKLPVVGSYDNLKTLLQENADQNGFSIGYYRNEKMRLAVPEMAMSMIADSAKEEVTNDADYSQTNTQVQGVDEADLVKTDGKYIYKVSQDQVLVVKALPAEEMEVVKTLRFNDERFNPVELYLDDERLIVIGMASAESASYPIEAEPLRNKAEMMPYRPYYNFATTRAIVYDIQDLPQITKVRELELEGNYLSSRKVGSSVYLLTNKYLDYYMLEQQDGICPRYRDSIQSEEFVEQSMQEVCYFPGHVQPNYLIVGALNLSRNKAEAQVQSFLGGGQNVYASTENLYVSLQTWENVDIRPMEKPMPRVQQEQTRIYRFGLKPGSVAYEAEGAVPGRILNQFSMDEHEGHFRIATTTGDMWREDEYTSKNNVYVLDQEMKITGSLEGIAPGERIYSTRFMGDRAYMVTFKDVDPFFVLDLKDPQKPEILGKLKIPGYSDYMHPYDENHIIGFGKDTVQLKGWNGESQAFYQGMKIGIFDVTDVSNPVEMSKTIIGDRGTDSELLHNHKALLFSRDKNLLAFPVTVMEIQQQAQANLKRDNVTEYGAFTFQGAYVYDINLEHGLQLKGRITHMDTDDYLKAGDRWYDSGSNVQRILYINDTLYTLSDEMIKANRLPDLKEISTVSFNNAGMTR